MVKIYLDVAHPTGPLYPRNPLIKLLINLNVGPKGTACVVTFRRLIDGKILLHGGRNMTPHLDPYGPTFTLLLI